MSNGSWLTVLCQPLGDERRRLPKQESEQVLRQAKRQKSITSAWLAQSREPIIKKVPIEREQNETTEQREPKGCSHPLGRVVTEFAESKLVSVMPSVRDFNEVNYRI
jgi:hypothetical protein